MRLNILSSNEAHPTLNLNLRPGFKIVSRNPAQIVVENQVFGIEGDNPALTYKQIVVFEAPYESYDYQRTEMYTAWVDLRGQITAMSRRNLIPLEEAINLCFLKVTTKTGQQP